jgi:hypothetical protein
MLTYTLLALLAGFASWLAVDAGFALASTRFVCFASANVERLTSEEV